MRRTALVTGALGFIPSALIKGLLSRGYYVVGIDNFLTGKIQNIESVKNDVNFQFIRGDVNIFDNVYSIFYNYTPDYVFHYAACVGVERTLKNPLVVLDDIKGFENILKLSRMFNIRRVFFSSSSEVYGEPVELPQVEDSTPLNSKLPYAVVKNIGEVYFRTWQKEFGLDFTIFRFFNTYGPGQSSDFVISKFMDLAISGEPLTIYGDGLQTRTFCFVDDNVDATIAAIDDESSLNATINIGADDEISILEVAEEIIKVTNSESVIKYLPPLAEGDMTRRRPDISRMRLLLRNRPLIGLNEGLRMICNSNLKQVEIGKRR